MTECKVGDDGSRGSTTNSQKIITTKHQKNVKMQALIESCIDPIVQIDASGVILLANPACCSTFQYEEKELLGKNISLLMPEPYSSQHSFYMSKYMATGKKRIMSARRKGRKLPGLRKDGTTFPMFLSLSEAHVRIDEETKRELNLTTDKCRKPGDGVEASGTTTTLFTGIMRDMSAEEEERQVMESMINSSVDPIVVIDTEGKIERVNPACSRVFGYDKAELVGRNITMLMPENHACKHHLYLERYLSMNPKEAENVSHVVGKGRDIVAKRKDGTAVPIYLTVSQFNLQSSKKRGFVGIMRDMTEKERAIKAEVERQKSEALLLNVLPESISHRMLTGEEHHEEVQIADHYENVTILFADVVGFTKFASRRSPLEVVHHLNRLFRRFDFLVGKYELEKIKTIGDAYMVVSGLDQKADHICRMLKFALDMMEEIKDYNKEQQKVNDETFGIRVGLHSGSVVAGVVGTKRRFFDLWGDTVNVASRMESGGITNCVQCTEVIAAEARKHDKDFVVFDRGVIDVKGKGEMKVFLVGPIGGKKEISARVNHHRRLRRRESIELHRKLEQELKEGTKSSRYIRAGKRSSFIPEKEKLLNIHLVHDVTIFCSGVIAGIALATAMLKVAVL